MSRTTNILMLMVMLATTQASMDFSIDTTWNGGALDHEPVQLVLAGQSDGSLQVRIAAPFFNDPANPGGKPGLPFFGLWEYEVVEAFFLNANDEYLEVEVCPWGQHIVLMLAGQRNTIRHSLPLEVTTDIDNNTNTWTGTATIPADYLPKAVTKFNAYAIHGTGENRIYESLYPAPPSAANPDFHALQYFQPIDLSSELPNQSTDPMSEFWEDAINGIFPYTITTDWKGESLDQEPIKLTIQGFEAGVELNVSAPFFDDPAPDAPAGAFMGLWDYEVVEMFFLNDNDEYLEVEIGPYGHHIVLLLQGKWNNIKDSLELDYFAERQGNTWSGSAMIPPSYFPPNVTRVNAFAIHGVGENRVYQALYPAPSNSSGPDFHRLELFQPIDFEYQVADNTEYSDIWEDAIEAAMLKAEKESNEIDEESKEALTSLGPFFVNEFTTEIPSEEEEDEAVTMLSVLDKSDEKEIERFSQNVGISQADTKDTEQPEVNEVNVNIRPLSRRPSITRAPSRRRPTVRRTTTVSPVQTKPTRSPARRRPRPHPQPVRLDNSLRPIQNRRLDDDAGSSGNFLPDQKFPTEVVRPTQFLRPIQRPVPQIVERPSQEETLFNQEDEKFHIPHEENQQQNDNIQTGDKPANFDGTDTETATFAPGTEVNSDIIPQEDNLQTNPLVPLELLHHPVCHEAGLIPDQLRCMVFHECVIENGQWQMYSWRCKRGHYYDPHSVACVRGRCSTG